MLPRVEALVGNLPAIAQLKRLAQAFEGTGLEDMLRIDFSVVNDINYYNGVLFKGFVEGVPQSVLSGGQYDRLMHKLGRQSGAIGFAVYTDLLEQLIPSEDAYDIDTLILYNSAVEMGAVIERVAKEQQDGKRVIAQSSIPDNLRYRHLIQLENGR